MGRYDRDVRLVDQSGDAITPGNPLPVTGGGGGGGAVTIADGADVTQGAIADAAVTSDAAGTVSAKLRGLVAILANVWDSGSGKLKVDAGTIGTGQQDKSAFVEGTTNFTPFGGVRNDTLAGDVGEDQAAAARITPKRGVHVNLRADDGTELGTSSAPVRIDPTGTTAQPVTDNGGSLTVDDGGGSLTVDGTITITPGTTATRTSVAATTSSTTLLAANANRKGVSVYNESNNILHLALGTAASLTDYTVKIGKNFYWEMPFNYTGIITGIWDGSNGSARITEIT